MLLKCVNCNSAVSGSSGWSSIWVSRSDVGRGSGTPSIKGQKPARQYEIELFLKAGEQRSGDLRKAWTVR